jgi:enoyl-CoA hydratase
MNDAQDLILTERKGAVAVVTMNRPRALNALSRALRAELARTIDGLDRDPAVRAVVLTGAGDRAFSAGLDLKELGADPRALGSIGAPRPEDDPLRAIEGCRHPVIAAINGAAVTGGFELALACDIVLASSEARFADTHVRVGVLPGWGLSQKLARIVGPSRAKEISFTGRFVDAETAAAWGLVSRVVAPDDLLDEAVALAAETAEADPQFLQALKRLIDDGLGGTLADGRALETARSAEWNRQQTPEALEARREAVFARGRASRKRD